ncbi:unnamed protein product [Gongylonema pulchrum]|uniref:Helicase ATP-binding domain-containing protein n=1 Tax=Gongylonema pulchrum TaxID=637853 RepID=A0A183DCP1_9BILA|nr:unnamed protein product [Gongylonema pulchrum]
MTAQIFLDLVDHAFFDMNRAAVIIVDECHHSLGIRHPFRLIMNRYGQLAKANRPRILGLTASLINSRTSPDKLEQLLQKLEAVMFSSIETASDLVSVNTFLVCFIGICSSWKKRFYDRL